LNMEHGYGPQVYIHQNIILNHKTQEILNIMANNYFAAQSL
jgi:hypothetical protein